MMAKRKGERANAGGGLAPISETKEAFSKLAIDDDDDEDDNDNDGISPAKRAPPERMDSAASSSDDPSPIYLVNENTGQVGSSRGRYGIYSVTVSARRLPIRTGTNRLENSRNT